MVEQGFVGIAFGQQAQQQFVEIEAAHQRMAAQHQAAALPFRRVQGAQLGAAEPGQGEGLERDQARLQRRPGTPRTARHQAEAAVMA